MKRVSLEKILKIICGFFTVFLIVAFVITCSLMLFIKTLQGTIGHDFTQEEITAAAKATMLNVFLLSFAFFVIDHIRRKLTVERPVKKITDATEKLISGDFTYRIPKATKLSSYGDFNEIIACINKMAEELSGIETLRTDFVASVSHEMKTPLAVMQNYGTLLQAPELSDKARLEYAKAITDSSRRLADMMTNILKLNRLENQQIYPRTEMYDLSEQLCECLLQFENVWEKKNIELDTDIDDDVFVSSDRELLSLVWNNLFSNAFKFTDDGGSVRLSLHADGAYAVIKVADTGCGISQEVGERIFEKFYQGDNSHSTEGNGLGLALVKRVINIIGGEIGVESALGKGTTFTVRLRRSEHEVE